MALVRMDIQSVVVGGGPMASLVILRPRRDDESGTQLPIRIGRIEAAAISMGVNGSMHERPMTHDLLQNVITSLGATIVDIVIADVSGTTFYAQIHLVSESGEPLSIDARPSDAIALAVRAHVPIYANDYVLSTATLPDFDAVERDEQRREAEAFHEFVEGLSPEDFSA